MGIDCIKDECSSKEIVLKPIQNKNNSQFVVTVDHYFLNELSKQFNRKEQEQLLQNIVDRYFNWEYIDFESAQGG
jgi:hypothetical protein